jgi:pimeloyl-ACP methyl ester carboxylesterase
MPSNKTIIFYLHGAPGSKAECAIFEKQATQHNVKLIGIDRYSIEALSDDKDYYQQIAKNITDIAGDKPVNIIGFSIGAHVALEVSAILGSQVNQLHLVSAAAPLSHGDFLDTMAGGAVFKLARDKPLLFSLLTSFQKLLATVAPKLLTRMLFASATGKDKSLSKERDFREYITPILSNCFSQSSAGYKRYIYNYVNCNGEINIQAPHTTLWHGTDDNWSPFSMASYLQMNIGGVIELKSLDSLSHYSTLFHAAPLIFQTMTSMEKQQ